MDNETVKEEVRRLRAEGITGREIARRLGLTDSKVVRLSQGLPLPSKTLQRRQKALELRATGMTYARIAEELGVSWGTAERWLATRHKKYSVSPQLKERLRKILEDKEAQLRLLALAGGLSRTGYRRREEPDERPS